jgi:hypothetical protein
MRGVCFSPAGLLTPFHLGASHRLQQLGLLNAETALSGASGGALAAVTSALNVYLMGSGNNGNQAEREAEVVAMIEKVRTSLLSIATSSAQEIVEEKTTGKHTEMEHSKAITEEDKKFLTLSGSVYVAKQCRDLGTRGTLRHALDRVLETILPDKIHNILNDRPAPCTVAYAMIQDKHDQLQSSTSKKKRFLAPQFISEYQSKEDVVDCLRASCNIPFYFNGNQLTVPVRGHGGVDGGLAVHPYRFGCPLTGAGQEEFLITPFHASRLTLFFNPQRLQKYQEKYFGQTATPTKHFIISPDDIGKDPIDIAKYFPFSSLDLMFMALDVPRGKRGIGKISDSELAEKYEMLFIAGEESVQRWYERKYLKNST